MMITDHEDVSRVEHRWNTREMLLICVLCVLWLVCTYKESKAVQKLITYFRIILIAAIFILVLLFGAPGATYLKG